MALLIEAYSIILQEFLIKTNATGRIADINK